MRRSTSRKTLLTSVFLMVSLATVAVADDWTQQAKLTASDAAAGDHFGCGVSIDGEYAIAGACDYDHDSKSNTGSAYMFLRSGANWSQQASLTASDAAVDDRFGQSVAISGSRAMVGAYGADFNGQTQVGAAYAFERSGATWTQTSKLVASDATSNEYFGYAVAIDGDYSIVGAYGHDREGITDAGAAYVFHRSDGVWAEQAKLMANDYHTSDQFGLSVAINGDYAIVGAHYDDDSYSNAGSAYIFHRDSDIWTQQQKLVSNDPQSGEYFGYSVAIDGDYVVVGAHGDHHDGYNYAGSAYVFHLSDDTWSFQDKLTAADPGTSDGFGISVAINGDRVIVGSHYDNDGGSSSGSAYIFERSGSNWTQEDKLTAGDPAASDNFGHSVSLSGNSAMIGSIYDDDAGSGSGSAYVFVVPEPSTALMLVFAGMTLLMSIRLR